VTKGAGLARLRQRTAKNQQLHGPKGSGLFVSLGVESAPQECPAMANHYTTKKWTTAVLVVTALFPISGWAQSKNALVGTWKLISATETTKEGEVRAAYGWQNEGLLTYTADGRMMAITTKRGRKPLSVPDNIGAPAEERAEAFATMTAYAGSYTLQGDKVIHHIEVSSMPNAVNTDQVRLITNLKGNSLSLRILTMVNAGPQIAYREFVWERISK
jgi:Lipocalin-like domain